MSEELIDNIVSNESLGIKKKPSAIKIISVFMIILVAGAMSYSFYMKNQVEQVQPKLDLGGTLPAAAPVQPIKPAIASEEAAAQPVQATPTQNTSVTPLAGTQPAAVASADLNKSNTVTATQSVQSPSNASPVTPAPQSNNPTAVPITAQTAVPTSTPVTNPVSNPSVTYPVTGNNDATKVTNSEPIHKAATEQTILPSEIVVNAPIEKKVVKKSRPKPVTQKVKASSVKEETPAQAIPMEEGVTREEIIVIQ